MSFRPLFGQITILSLCFVTFRVSRFYILHLTHKTVKLCLQNTLNMSKTTRVYFGVLQPVLPAGMMPPMPLVHPAFGIGQTFYMTPSTLIRRPDDMLSSALGQHILIMSRFMGLSYQLLPWSMVLLTLTIICSIIIR